MSSKISKLFIDELGTEHTKGQQIQLDERLRLETQKPTDYLRISLALSFKLSQRVGPFFGTLRVGYILCFVCCFNGKRRWFSKRAQKIEEANWAKRTRLSRQRRRTKQQKSEERTTIDNRLTKLRFVNGFWIFPSSNRGYKHFSYNFVSPSHTNNLTQQQK